LEFKCTGCWVTAILTNRYAINGIISAEPIGDIGIVATNLTPIGIAESCAF
jgi:hypothetical protein